MKKLMIAAAIVCATVAVQASTYNWNFASSDSIYDGYNAAKVGDKSANAVGAGLAAYLIAYDATAMNQDTILSALRSGKSVTQAAGSSLIATSATGSDGKIASVKWTDEVGAAISVFEVVVKGDDVFLSKNGAFNASLSPQETLVDISTTKSKTLADNQGKLTFATEGAGWYNAAAVPEPTSGLLLLLGVAGLALRRRRA